MDHNFGLIVKKYRSLVENKFSASAISMDTNFLQLSAFFLSRPVNEENTESAEVVRSIIDIIFTLSATRSNMARLSGVYGIIQAVQYVVNRKSLPEDLNLKARHILKRLSKHYVTKKLTFYVSGLNKDIAPVIESAFVTTKGVVSVVIDPVHLRSIVRVLSEVQPTEVAASVFEQTGIEIKLVSRNPYSQEILIPLVELKSTEFGGDVDWPCYPDEGSPPKLDNAITHRLDKDKATNWIDSTITFFQKSFYW